MFLIFIILLFVYFYCGIVVEINSKTYVKDKYSFKPRLINTKEILYDVNTHKFKT